MKYLAIALLFYAGSTAHAACGLTISAGNITIDWTLNYTIKAFTFTVNKPSVPECYYGVGITKGTAADYASRRALKGGNAAKLQLYSDTTKDYILKDKGDFLVANEAIRDRFLDSETGNHTLTYYVDIPYTEATTPRLLAAGDFIEDYTFNVYEGADPLTWGAPVTSATVRITIRVPKIIALSLVDSGGSFDDAKTIRNANFGLLSPGQSTLFDARIRSNAGYRVTFQSANSSNLKHSAANSLIPYKLYVDSAYVNLTGGGAVQGLNVAGQTGLSGQGYSVRAVIQPFSGAGRLAGAYSDQITVISTTTE